MRGSITFVALVVIFPKWEFWGPLCGHWSMCGVLQKKRSFLCSIFLFVCRDRSTRRCGHAMIIRIKVYIRFPDSTLKNKY